MIKRKIKRYRKIRIAHKSLNHTNYAVKLITHNIGTQPL